MYDVAYNNVTIDQVFFLHLMIYCIIVSHNKSVGMRSHDNVDVRQNNGFVSVTTGVFRRRRRRLFVLFNDTWSQ